MNRHVPTLLGIVIILLVVLLVLGIYNYKLSERMSQGGEVVGTVGGQALTGQEQPAPQITPSEVLGGQGRGARGAAVKGGELSKMPTHVTEAQGTALKKMGAEVLKERKAEHAKKSSNP